MPQTLLTGRAPGSRIVGVGAYRPARSVPNAEVAARINVSGEWIAKRSGIVRRGFAAPAETLAVMAVNAARAALEAAAVTPAMLDCVIVATITHLTQMPAVAVDIAHRLGARGAAAFDISAACAGFCHGLALADTLVRAGTATHVLLIGADKMTDIVDPGDPSTAFLFADGAGAVVVGASPDPEIGPVVWGADGSRLDAITMTGHWTPELREDITSPWPSLAMSGWKVYRWATETLGAVLSNAIERAGLTPHEIAAFIPHQANMLITEALAKDIGLSPEIAIARDISDSGNTSAASIPLAMQRMLATGEARGGDLALLAGFGSGLVYAAQVVRLPGPPA